MFTRINTGNPVTHTMSTPWQNIGGLPATRAFVRQTVAQIPRAFSDYDHAKGGRLLEDPITKTEESFLANVEELKRTEVYKAGGSGGSSA